MRAQKRKQKEKLRREHNRTIIRKRRNRTRHAQRRNHSVYLKHRSSGKKKEQRERKKTRKKSKRARREALVEKRRKKEAERKERLERYNKRHNITTRRPWIEYDYDYIEKIPRNIDDIAANTSATLAPRHVVGQNFNVLVILANQFRHDAIGPSVEGANKHDLSRVAKTPHLSALRKSGMWFKQAVTHAAASVPSRAALLTGTAGNATGVQRSSDSRVPWTDRRTFADVLKRRGYMTLFYGDWVNNIDSLAEFDYTMFSKQLDDRDKRYMMDYNAKLEAAYKRWLKDVYGLTKEKNSTKANKRSATVTVNSGVRGDNEKNDGNNGSSRSRRRLGKANPHRKKYPELHANAGHGLPYRPVAEVSMPLLLKLLQEVDRSRNRTARKFLTRSKIPTWALFGVQPIERHQTKSMFVANKTVKALKAIVDLRRAVGADKKFAMASDQLTPPLTVNAINMHHYAPLSPLNVNLPHTCLRL